MKPTLPVILNAVKDPSVVGGVPSPREPQAQSWILRLAQNDLLGLPVLRLGLCLLFSTLGPLVRASEQTDLGQGLGYLRVHILDEALKPVAGTSALVLDLRRAMASDVSVAAFQAALVGRGVPSAPLFILVSPDTPAALASALKGGLITLGIKGSLPEPQVVVDQSPEDDRHAYDALETGTALAQLISGKIEKERFDEASLVHEFKNGNHDALPGDRPGQIPAGQQTGTVPPAVPALRSSGSEGGSPVARLTDRVLQRAVHLHRALQALKAR